jgi:hypothetical protein
MPTDVLSSSFSGSEGHCKSVASPLSSSRGGCKAAFYVWSSSRCRDIGLVCNFLSSLSGSGRWFCHLAGYRSAAKHISTSFLSLGGATKVGFNLFGDSASHDMVGLPGGLTLGGSYRRVIGTDVWLFRSCWGVSMVSAGRRP